MNLREREREATRHKSPIRRDAASTEGTMHGGTPRGRNVLLTMHRSVAPRLIVLVFAVVVMQVVILLLRLDDISTNADSSGLWSLLDTTVLSISTPVTEDNDATNSLSFFDVEHPDLVYYSRSQRGQRLCSRGEDLTHHPSSPVTVITLVGQSGRKEHPGFMNFLKSLDYNGFDRLVILDPADGLQEIRQLKRTNYSAEADFWVNRLREFISAVKSFHDSNIILFCDALDVYFTQSPWVLLERYKALNKEVVFATEVLCDTVSCRTDIEIKDFQIKIAPSNNTYRFLNAGMFMGTADGLLRVLSCALRHAEGGRDDQTAFTICYKMDSDRIGLDYDSLLFGNIPPVQALFDESWQSYTLHSSDGHDVTIAHRRHQQPRTFPVAFHFLGMSFRRDLPFVPCQQFLKAKYNELGNMIHLSDFKINKFAAPHPVDIALLVTGGLQIDHFIQSLVSNPSDSADVTCPVKSFRGIEALLLSGWAELLEAVASLLSPRQLFDTSSIADITLTTIYIYITVTMGRNALPKVRSEFNLDGLERFYTEVSICLIEKLQRSYPSNVVIPNVVFDKAVGTSIGISSEALTGRSAIRAFSPSSNYGLHWALSRPEISKSTFLLTASGSCTYGSKVITSLLGAYYSSSRSAAYGHFGLLVDKAPSAAFPICPVFNLPLVKSPSDAAYVRSAQHWSEAPHAVDVLSSKGAVLYDNSVIRNPSLLNELKKMSVFSSDHDSCLSPYGLDAVLSGHLSRMGIPRIQIPSYGGWGNHFVDRTVVGMELPRRTVNHWRNVQSSKAGLIRRSNIMQCQAGELFFDSIRMSWKYSGESGLKDKSKVIFNLRGNKESWNHKPVGNGLIIVSLNNTKRPIDVDEYKYCPRWMYGENSFSAIPPVPQLSGFNWKQNWVSASYTSPCTCHLFTRIVNAQLFLGKGQYMGEGQYIASRSGAYILRLEAKARLCLYLANDLMGLPKKCLGAPSSELINSGVNNSISPLYVSLVDGSICFFDGIAPHFGGSISDSGHKRKVWCSPNNNPTQHRKLIETINRGSDKGKETVSSALKNRIGAMMKSICTQLYVPPSSWEDIFLHVEDDGSFGLFTSLSCRSSHQLCSPEKRTATVTMLKCF